MVNRDFVQCSFAGFKDLCGTLLITSSIISSESVKKVIEPFLRSLQKISNLKVN